VAEPIIYFVKKKKPGEHGVEDDFSSLVTGNPVVGKHSI